MIGLHMRRVSKRFPAPEGGGIIALEDFSLDILPGEFVVVVGPNGSGKSTLLNLIAGREQADAGEITATMAGRELDWTRAPPRSRSRYIARIHQDPTAGTADDLTVLEHLRLAGLSRPPIPFLTAVPARIRGTIRAKLGATALADKPDALVAELSHGQRQLLALQMAAARSAQILLLDEPTASLDRANAAFCMQCVQDLRHRLRVTVLLVTHDMAIAAQFGDRLIVLRNGRLQAEVTGAKKDGMHPEDVFHLCGFDAPALDELSFA